MCIKLVTETKSKHNSTNTGKAVGEIAPLSAENKIFCVILELMIIM
jgi:hypothetical protein